MLFRSQSQAVARILENMSPQQAANILNLLEPSHSGTIIAAMDPAKSANIVRHMQPEKLAPSLTLMNPDTTAGVIAQMPLPYRAGNEQLEQLTGRTSHQGTALQCSPLPESSWESLKSEKRECLDTLVVLDQIEDPQNLGEIGRASCRERV